MGKKIILIDGGPRKNMNTAKMIEAFAEGVIVVGLYVYFLVHGYATVIFPFTIMADR